VHKAVYIDRYVFSRVIFGKLCECGYLLPSSIIWQFGAGLTITPYLAGKVTRACRMVYD